MTTTKQLEANRKNSKKSTGPRTDAGKARSSQNAVTHGLTGQQVVMPGEDPDAFEALRDSLYAEYQPNGPVAEQLVEHLAMSMWRLRRIPQIEAGIYAHFAFEHERVEAARKVDRHVKYHNVYDPDEHSTILDEKAHTAAKKALEHAKAKLQHDKPVSGAVFRDAERTLTSLVRIAGAIESSLYKTIEKLDAMKAERSEFLNDKPIIDAEVQEDGWEFVE